MDTEEDGQVEGLGSTTGRARRAVVLIAGALAGMVITSLVYFHPSQAPRLHAPGTHQVARTVWLVSGPECVPQAQGAAANPTWIEVTPSGTGPVPVLVECGTWTVHGDRTVRP